MINNLKFNLTDDHDEKQIMHQLADQYTIKKAPRLAGKLGEMKSHRAQI